MHLRRHSSICDIGVGEWNAIVGRDCLICTHAYLEAVERSRVNVCHFYYPVVHDDEGIVAHACAYCIGTELDSFAQGPIKRMADRIRRRWGGFLVLRSVECGTPVALGSTISYRAGVDQTRALRLLVEDIESVARELGVGTLLFRDFRNEDRPGFRCLEQWGYLEMQNLPEAQLDIHWGDFDEYMASMRSEYRSKLRVQKRKFSDNNGSLDVIEDFAPYAVELTALWRNAYDRAKEYRREVLEPRFFESMAELLPGRVQVILARVGGRVAGFLLLLCDDDCLTTLFSGLDYAISRESAVYFNLFYKAVEMAISSRMKRIRFGITTLAPKLDLGARPDPLFMYMKHLNPFLNRIVPRAFAAMTPPCILPARRVFKQ